MGESIQIVYYLSMLTLGGALGYLLSQQMKKNALSQLEQEAEQRAQRRLAEEERAQRLQLLEERIIGTSSAPSRKGPSRGRCRKWASARSSWPPAAGS